MNNPKRNLIIFAALLMLITMAMKDGDKPAYRIFENGGKESSWKELLKSASEADVVFFGEIHDNAIAHWLEYELARDLFELKGSQLKLGAEMFESDNQLILNEYLQGFIKTKNFEDECKLWDNYKNDYKPLVEYAKEKKLEFIATNIPRRYAAMVNKGGFESLDTLPVLSRTLIAPLPVKYDTSLACYRNLINMEGVPHATPNLARAQAIKDATMAWFIGQNMKAGQTMIHYNGSYHSDNYESIIWYLKKYRPELKIMTITTVTQDEIKELSEESRKLADYIICIPETMTRTY